MTVDSAGTANTAPVIRLMGFPHPITHNDFSRLSTPCQTLNWQMKVMQYYRRIARKGTSWNPDTGGSSSLNKFEPPHLGVRW